MISFIWYWINIFKLRRRYFNAIKELGPITIWERHQTEAIITAFESSLKVLMATWIKMFIIENLILFGSIWGVIYLRG